MISTILKYNIKDKDIWLPSVLGRSTFLFLGLSFLNLYVYLLGNIQGFSSQTLVILFSIESWVLSLAIIAGVFSSITYCIVRTRFRRFNSLHIVFSLMATSLSFALFLGVSLLQAFMEGYSGESLHF